MVLEKMMSPLSIKDIKERCDKMAALAAEREATEVLQLPLWPEDKRGTPNSFLRSALFAAIQSKDRVFMKNSLLFSQQGIAVRFTGEQLNQEDMTVWLALIDLARTHPLGTECTFSAYGILKHMSLGVGGREHERLHANIKRFTACLVEIEGENYIYGGSLIESFEVEKKTKRYKVKLNRDLIKLFGEHDWTAINWEQRKLLRNKPLASKLHEYFSSHRHPKPVTIEFIYKITGSANKDKYGFKRQVANALAELIKIGFLESHLIEDNKVAVKRVSSDRAGEFRLR
jgi:hypothetical protein